MNEGYLVDSNGVKYYPRPSFHVGCILESAVPIDPGKMYGGIWEEYGVGRILVGVDTTQSEFNTSKKTGGNKKHKHLSGISYITHGGIAYVGISNSFGLENVGNIYDYYGAKVDVSGVASDINTGTRYYTTEESSFPPYITAYRYVRIA